MQTRLFRRVFLCLKFGGFMRVFLMLALCVCSMSVFAGGLEDAVNSVDVFLDGMPVLAQSFAVVVSSFTVVTAITPTKADNKVLNLLLRVANILAGNVGKNKNADA